MESNRKNLASLDPESQNSVTKLEEKSKYQNGGNMLNNSETDIGVGSMKDTGRDASAGQDVFGDETNAEVQYKTMGWV